MTSATRGAPLPDRARRGISFKPSALALAWAALMGVAGAAVALVFRDYGASWDESTNLRYGELALAYLTSGLQDTSVHGFLNLRHYGALFDVVVAAVVRLAPSSGIEIHHAFTALAGLATVPALGRLGRRLDSPLAGLCGGLALAVMPVFAGHAFVNGKDVPFACAFTWSMVCLIDLFLLGPSWGRVAACGLTFGAAAAVRPGGFPLVIGLLGAAAALAAATGRLEIRGRALFLAARAGAIVGAAWAVMVLVWPWAHGNPILRPLESMRVAASFPAVYPVLFEGRYVSSNALPRHYLVEYLAITTPPTLLLLAAAGAAVALRWWIAEPRSRRAFAAAITGLWLAAPILLWTLVRSNILDGLRHFLFVLPALAVFAGLGAAMAWEALAAAARARFAGAHRFVLAAGAALIAFLLLAPVADLVRLHPYQMTYFNRFVGGLEGAAGDYETDYWLTSYKEAMAWIQAARPATAERPTRVLVAANELSRLCAEHYAGPHTSIRTTFTRDTPAEIPPDVDVYLATTRYGLDANYPGSPIVHEVGRDGAVFAVVRARKGFGS